MKVCAMSSSSSGSGTLDRSKTVIDCDFFLVPSYQPEIAYDIFMRATFNQDIATGTLPVHDEYSTVGPASTFYIKNAIPPWPESVCYILNPGSCTPEQYAQVINGTVVVKDYVVVEYDVDVDVEKKVTDNKEMLGLGSIEVVGNTQQKPLVSN